MAQFLTPQEVKKEVKNIFTDAELGITIVSPFIKLDKTLKECLIKHVNNPDFHIELLFGKNERDKAKSLSTFDIEFFKQFQNIEIRYNENLHAKYYANENKSIITSLNLHTFSIANNIEVGVMFERKFGAGLANLISSNLANDYNSDKEAYEYFDSIFEKSELIFMKNIKEKKRFFGLFSSYDGTEISVDSTDEIYNSKNRKSEVVKGYCIRTGVEIAFNMNHPFSKEAYKSWAKFKNKTYPEKYCHYSGKKSNGETCFNVPVLAEYYQKAMSIKK